MFNSYIQEVVFVDNKACLFICLVVHAHNGGVVTLGSF